MVTVIVCTCTQEELSEAEGYASGRAPRAAEHMCDDLYQIGAALRHTFLGLPSLSRTILGVVTPAPRMAA